MKTLLIALAVAVLPQAKPKPGASDGTDWNQFRGPKRDAISPDTGLLKEWPASGPPIAWKTKGLGSGYSSVCVSGARVYTMGEISGDYCLIALNAADGKMVWTARIAKVQDVPYPGTRATPATDGAIVVALSPHGDLVAVQAATGKEMWRQKFDGPRPGWGFAESPLIDGPLVVATPGGGSGTVAAYNKANGQQVWRSSELKDAAAYASIVPVEIGKIPLYLVFTAESVAGLVAKTGRVAWKTERKGATAVIPTPVYKDGMVFVSSGYNIGHNGFQVALVGGGFKVQQAYSGKEMINHHGGLVVVGDHVYGLSDNGGLKCIELKTGKVAWANDSVGKGSIAYADGHLYCRSERGPIALVEASPAAYKEAGRFTPPDCTAKDVWAHPVVSGGKFYVRDQDTLICFDVKAK
jgi:outer membrane protein assembly factor BamB